MTPSDIPCSWRRTLRSIQEHAPEAFIGGGALRDLENGRPVKDLDVFVPEYRAGPSLSFVIHELDYHFNKMVPMYHLGSDDSVCESREYTQTGCIALNLVLLAYGYKLPDALDRFDLGLCQIAFDGKSIMTTAAYLKDRDERTITVCRADNLGQIERTKRRYARLHEKYQGYPLLVPPEFNHLQ